MIYAINAHRQKQKSFSSFEEAYFWAIQNINGIPDSSLQMALNNFLKERRIMISPMGAENQVFAEDITIIDDEYFSNEDW